MYLLTSDFLVLVNCPSLVSQVVWESFPIVCLRPRWGLGVGSSVGAISMFVSTIEMTDILAMKTYIVLSWIS